MRLAPSSNYDIRLKAVNQRPVMPNHSEYVPIKAKTKGNEEKMTLRKVLRII